VLQEQPEKQELLVPKEIQEQREQQARKVQPAKKVKMEQVELRALQELLD
jgi:hypothetical protein